MFLFILESIGTSELILIAGIALIIFGPRKLPQMARTIGKTMAEFRSATNEFKTTWEKEVAFAEEEEKNIVSNNLINENHIPRTVSVNTSDSETTDENQLSSPLIKELSASDIAEKFHDKNITKPIMQKEESLTESKISEKRDWL